VKNLIDILRETEEDRSSPSSPPLHFEIEVDLSDDEDAEDLSHFRRLQTSSSTLLLQLATATSAITPATTFDFKSVDYPKGSKSNSLASKLTVLVNDPTRTRGLTVLSVNTESGSVTGKLFVFALLATSYSVPTYSSRNACLLISSTQVSSEAEVAMCVNWICLF
jgi:hypothetical protein